MAAPPPPPAAGVKKPSWRDQQKELPKEMYFFSFCFG